MNRNKKIQLIRGIINWNHKTKTVELTTVTEKQYKDALLVINQYEKQMAVCPDKDYDLRRLFLILHDEAVGIGNKQAVIRAENTIRKIDSGREIHTVSDLVEYYKKAAKVVYPPEHVFLNRRNCGKKSNEIIMNIIKPHLEGLDLHALTLEHKE